jgi:hypothetical protein
MALGYDGSIRIDTRLDPKGFNKGIKSITASVKKLAGVLGIVLGVAGLTLFAKSAVDAAADLANAMTGLQSVTQGTGKSFSEAQKFIMSYIEDGLVPATNAITAYKNLALRGYDTSQIEQVLIALKDSAAFGRQASLSLGYAVQSASEGLKNENSILVDNAGVTKNVAMMWKEYATSIGTTANNLTRQQKIQAEVNGILAETRFQTGDAAKLAGGYSGMIAGLSTSFYNLRVALGKAIIPILSAIIPYIKAVIDWLVVLVNQFAQVISLLFGVEIGIGSAGSSADSTADSIGGVADAAQDAAGGAGSLADNTQAAADAAKGALAAFDDLNVLSQNQPSTPSSGGGGGSGGGAGVPDVGGISAGALGEDVISESVSNLTEKVERLKEVLKNLFEPTIIALRHLWEALKPVGDFVAQGAIDFYEHFLVPVGQWVLGEGLPRFIDAIANGLETIDWPTINSALVELWDALAPFAINVGEGLLWLWENVLVPLAAWTISDVLPKFLIYLAVGITVVSAVLERLAPLAEALFDTFLDPLAAWLGEDVATLLAAFAAAWLAVNIAVGIWTVVAGIAAVATTAFGIAVAVLTSPITLVILAIGALVIAGYLLITHWDEVKAKAAELWDSIGNTGKAAVVAFGIAMTLFVLGPIGLVILAIGALILVIYWLVTHWDEVKAKAAEVWDSIVEKWHGAWAWFNSKVLIPLKRMFFNAWESIKGWFSGAWEDIKSIWEKATDWFRENVVDPVRLGFDVGLELVRTAFDTIWTGITDLIKTQINIILGFIQAMVDGAAAGVNTVISGLNSLSVSVPDWIPLIGGKSWSVNINPITAPTIPLLAQGAVIPPNAAFLAMLGDNKSQNELLAPENLLRQIVREESQGDGGREITIRFEGSLGELVRLLKPVIDQEDGRVGGSLVKGIAS